MVGNNAINGSSKVTIFTSSATWTKDVRSKYITLFAWNPGGGGGSGRQGASGSAGGGGGGSGARKLVVSLDASFFGSTESVFIFAAGTGAPPVTTANTDGISATPAVGNGIVGIGTFRSPGFSAAGGGTTTNAASGGSSFEVTNANRSFFPTTADWQGIGTNAAGTDGYSELLALANGTGAGGGSGADSSTERIAGNGGQISQTFGGASGSIYVAAAIGGSESATINGQNGVDSSYPSGGLILPGSSAGGGGGQHIGPVAGNGGLGGTPGGGGGGGGGSLNGTNSGAGGDGSRSELWIIEYF